MQYRRDYIGRFAPTPSGPLHFGSIVAALASYLDARKHNGLWLLRIDDLDTPRINSGASDSILRTLETLGLAWDGEIVYQSNRHDAYAAALDRLQRLGLLYKCYCTRKQVKGLLYPGTCRNLPDRPDTQFAIRVITSSEPIGFTDRIQGDYSRNLQQQSGDFIIKRADGLFAYHLACVTDDAWQGVTDIVRGADLIDSTPQQIHLQRQLDLPTPAYSHFPVGTDVNGVKISKRYGATDALLEKNPAALLVEALSFLGQTPTPGLENSRPGDVVAWAMENWDMSQISRVREMSVLKYKDQRGKVVTN